MIIYDQFHLRPQLPRRGHFGSSTARLSSSSPFSFLVLPCHHPESCGYYDSSDSVDPRQHMAAATVAPASAVGASTSRPAPALPGPASAAGAGLLARLAAPVLVLLDRGRPASAGYAASSSLGRRDHRGLI